MLVISFVQTNLCIDPDIESVIKQTFLEVEPEHTIVWFSMQTVLLCLEKHIVHFLFTEKVFFLHQVAYSDYFQEGVTVLRSELNGKLKILQSLCEVGMPVFWMICHGKSSSFTPYFSGLWDFSQSLTEGLKHQIKISSCLGSLMLQLDENGPKSSS